MANTGPTVGAICDLLELQHTQVASWGLPHVQAGYERVLLGEDPRYPGAVHDWSFLEPIAELALAEDITGTATGVYSATTELTTITATAAIFSPCQVGETITITTVGDLTIASYTSPLIVVATAGENFAGKAVSLRHSGVYALPADFGGMVEPLVYPYSTSLSTPPLVEVSVPRLFELWRDSATQADATNYAIVPDTFTAATGQRWKLYVYPRPDADRIVRYRYRMVPVTLADDGTFLPGGTTLGRVYTMAAQAEAEFWLAHKKGPWEERYQMAMAAAITRDQVFKTDHQRSLADIPGGL